MADSAIKPWYQSKTVWLNVVTMFAALGVILGGVKLTPTETGIVGAIVAAANVALRVWFTGSPVTSIGAQNSTP